MGRAIPLGTTRNASGARQRQGVRTSITKPWFQKFPEQSWTAWRRPKLSSMQKCDFSHNPLSQHQFPLVESFYVSANPDSTYHRQAQLTC
jgi:hypothetical protein